MDNIATQLKNLGLSDYEALVYGTLLLNSPTNATFIAKKCSLSRSSVYTTLNTLIGKGLVGTTYKNDVKQFVAEDSTSFEQLLNIERASLDAKYTQLESLKKTLQLFSKTDTQVPQLIFFEGQEGLKKIYLSMMREAPKNSTRYLLRDEFIWQPEWSFILKQEWSDRVKRWAAEKNIKTKLLINSSKIEKSKIRFYNNQTALAHRFLPPQNAIHQFAQYVIGDTIAILSMEQNNLIGIKITNKHLADNFKKTFDTLWAGAAAK